MSDEIISFSSDDFGSIRSFEKDNEIWFIASDVAKVLGYKNTRDALSKHVWEEDKNTVAFHDSIPGNPNRVIINESGLYSLIFHSKLEKAKEFSHWVTKDVLPSIRKHGVYISPDLLEDKEVLLKKISELEEENKRLLENKTNSKVSYLDYLKRREWSTCNTATVAADFDLSARKLNRILEEEGIQYKDEYKHWQIAPQYRSKEYVEMERYFYGEGYCVTMKWTINGCLFIAEILRKHNIYPLIEKNGG